MVQNKLHYAAHGHTTAEVQAMRRHSMHMSDYVDHLNNVPKSTGEEFLTDSGKVSHLQAMEKARQEYQKYLIQNLSPVEEAYLQTIKDMEEAAKKNVKGE